MTGQIAAIVSDALAAGGRLPASAEAVVMAALADGREDEAIAALERLVAGRPAAARGWALLGFALHAAQRYEPALKAVDRATMLAPHDVRAAIAAAQLRYETGRPSADAFAALARRLPGERGILAGWAGAKQADGDPAGAEALLEDAVLREPTWLEGQARLATMRRTAGRDDYDRGYAEACARYPESAALWLAWFQLLAKAQRWGVAEDVLCRAERRLGALPALAMSRLYLLSASGMRADDPGLFADHRETADPGLAIAIMRHALRGGRAGEAATIGERFLRTRAAALFWPYLSLAWRMTGDGRAAWLDRPERFIRTYDLDLDGAELAELATLLRALHGQMAAPYLDQSVRGGTQTDRPLLFRHEPIIARTRAAIMAAVARHVAALPPHEPDHPLLAPPRNQLRLAGSWSVRLSAQGHHASHTHPAGWLSSACYMALPAAEEAGELLLGSAPPELGLPLAPYCSIKPKVGRLVLFPATMWHATSPFAAGERLTVAFDVAVPRG